MGAVVEFTRLLGGIASAPTSEIPFAGSFFDVQAGTWSAPASGEPEIFVLLAPEGYAHAGRSFGSATLDAGIDVSPVAFAATGIVPGIPSAESGIFVIGGGYEAVAAFGTAELTLTVTACPDGFDEPASFGLPRCTFPWTMNPAGHEAGVLLGHAFVESGVYVWGVGVSRTALFGKLGAESIVICDLIGLEQDEHYGMAGAVWRKCVRWDMLAEVRRNRELRACIRPVPKLAAEWHGEAAILREYDVGAEILRRIERHTVARRKNTLGAAICREKQG